MKRRSRVTPVKSAAPRKAPTAQKKRASAEKPVKSVKSKRKSRDEYTREGRRFGRQLAKFNRAIKTLQDGQAKPAGVYLSLDEARTALAQHRHHSDGNTGLGFAIGLAAVAVVGLGVVLVYLLLRKEGDKSTPLGLQGNTRIVEVIREVPVSPGVSVLQGAPTTARKRPTRERDDFDYENDDYDGVVYHPVPVAPQVNTPGPPSIATKLQSLYIPNDNPVRLFTATDRPWRVVVRTIGPPGAFGMYGTNYNSVAQSGVIGDRLLVPAGGWEELFLAPGDVLWARGATNLVNVTNTQISFAASVVV